jgi:membrane protein DedA with SNARE-associated domain
VITNRLHWQRSLLLTLFTIAALGAVMFGLRTYRLLLLLRSAYELGAPDVGSVRPWMTLDYVARTYRVPETALAEHLRLPSDVSPSTTLKFLADKQGLSRLEYVKQVQEAIFKLRAISPFPGEKNSASQGGKLGDELLAGLLVYGYPVLGLTLLLGTMGMPFPSALSVVVAGSLIAHGQMSWFWSGAVSVACSVLGDLFGYGIGQFLGREFLQRRGRWVGFTPSRQAQVEMLFQQWGTVSVLLSRSLVSFLSSAVNLLAGASRYPLRVFLPFAIVGRLIWTFAYLALGYGFGVVLEASADFLSSLSLLLAALAALSGLGFMLYRNHARLQAAQC